MRIAVIGAGSWGTTLANLLAKKGLDVTLWAYERELVGRLQASRVNDLFLPGVELDPRLAYSSNLVETAGGRQVARGGEPDEAAPHDRDVDSVHRDRHPR